MYRYTEKPLEYTYNTNGHNITLKCGENIYTYSGIYKIYELNSAGEGRVAQMAYDEETEETYPIENAYWLCKADMKRLAWDKYLGER